MDRRQHMIGTAALVAAALLAVAVVVGVTRGLSSGDWVIASTASVLLAAAVSQWAAIRAKSRGGRLLTGEFALLVALGVLGLTLCALDFVTGDRRNRAFTVLFAAGLIAVVGGVIGSYRRPLEPGATAGGTGN